FIHASATYKKTAPVLDADFSVSRSLLTNQDEPFFEVNGSARDSNCFISLSRAFLFRIRNAAPMPNAATAIFFIKMSPSSL
ncbi:hypothetical protein, partial [Sporosarcina luteola]|uniref:hypothetical protein n=1 Tax=Sporosarcina luteola TaxID=582850 RepID=UPI001C3F69A5